MATAVATTPTEPRIVNRWVQMIAGVIAMMAIANLQYAWTLFTTPLQKSLNATLAAVQVAFAAFILCETWLVPFEGYLIDRLGPRLVIGIGGILVGLGWIGAGTAASLHRPVYMVRARWRGRWRRLRRMHGQLAEVVSRSPWHVRRVHCWRLRPGNRNHRGSHRQDDESLRISAHLHLLGHHPRHHRLRRRHAHRRPAQGLDAEGLVGNKRQSENVDLRHDSLADDETAIVLRDLHHDDAGGFRRAGGHGADQAHRQVLQG